MATLQRILVVDDEPDIREIIRLSLELVGNFEILLCSSGHEALELAAGFVPDLLLLDVMMPDLDGPDTLLALRRIPELRQTPAIFLTARVQERNLIEYSAIGVLNVIAKPFNPMTLASTLEAIWSEHRGSTTT